MYSISTHIYEIYAYIVVIYTVYYLCMRILYFTYTYHSLHTTAIATAVQGGVHGCTDPGSSASGGEQQCAVLQLYPATLELRDLQA